MRKMPVRKMITATAAALLLCSGPSAAQDSVTVPATPQAESPAPDQAQSAIDALKGMSPEQRQQLFEAGVSKVQNLDAAQLQQLKSQFADLSPEDKKQLEGQILQQLQNDPKLKAEAEQRLQSMTPAQQQQLLDIYQK